MRAATQTWLEEYTFRHTINERITKQNDIQNKEQEEEWDENENGNVRSFSTFIMLFALQLTARRHTDNILKKEKVENIVKKTAKRVQFHVSCAFGWKIQKMELGGVRWVALHRMSLCFSFFSFLYVCCVWFHKIFAFSLLVRMRRSVELANIFIVCW